MARGYHVFRALSPSCPVDLTILNGTNVFRMEVTTGNYHPGGITYPAKDSSRFDVLAVVFHDGQILYQPDLVAVMGTASRTV
jgi:hypothetical protein